MRRISEAISLGLIEAHNNIGADDRLSVRLRTLYGG